MPREQILDTPITVPVGGQWQLTVQRASEHRSELRAVVELWNGSLLHKEYPTMAHTHGEPLYVPATVGTQFGISADRLRTACATLTQEVRQALLTRRAARHPSSHPERSTPGLTSDGVATAPAMMPQEAGDREDVLNKLATLDPITYDQRRDEAAALLGIRVSTLDTEVGKRRAHPQDTGKPLQGQPITVPATLAWEAPVDGATLVQRMVDLLRQYVSAAEWVYPVVALWILHTYLLDSLNITPRLRITSPKEACGKSVLASLVRYLSHKAIGTGHTTPAALFRILALGNASTAVLDEGDNLNWHDENLVAVLNAGWIKNQATVWRTVSGHLEPRAFTIWAALVIVSIGRVKGTVESRGIAIPMQRLKPTDQIADFYMAEQNNLIQPVADTLRRQALRWVQDKQDAITRYQPVLPKNLRGRMANNWRTLLTIAEVVGEPWASTSRQALQDALHQEQNHDDDSQILLLHDMQALFVRHHTTHVFTETLLAALHQMEHRPWAEYGPQRKPITATQIAGLLKPFGITSRSVRIGPDTAKGYKKADCQDAFNRYLPILASCNEERQGTEQTLEDLPQNGTAAHASTDANFHDSGAVTLRLV